MKTTRYREFLSAVPARGVRLCALHSDRYKTVRARVYLLEPIRPRIATANSLLARVLRTGSALHPSRRELARACEELYGAMLAVSVTRFADVQAVVASIEFPAERFLPKGSKELEGALALLNEVLTQPSLNEAGSELRAESVEQERYQLETELKSLQDDKSSWAAMLATQRTYAGTPGAVYEYGDVKDLPEWNAQKLHSRHQLLVSNAPVMAFVTGPVEEERALQSLASALTLAQGRRDQPAPARKLPHTPSVQRSRVKAEGEQAHLLFAWTGGGVYGRDDYAPTCYADAIFGGLSTSRLFKVVREEHGLAYAVSSAFHRARGVIVAQAAVDHGKADKAVRLIRGEFKRLKEGGFSDDEFEAARETLIESRKSAMDSMGERASDAVFQAVLGFKRKPEQLIKDLRQVTPTQVRSILKRLKPRSEFRLG